MNCKESDRVTSRFEILIPIILVIFSLMVSGFYYFRPESTISDIIFNPLIISILLPFALPYFIAKYGNKNPYEEAFFYSSIFPFFSLPYIFFSSESVEKFKISSFVCWGIGLLISLLLIFSMISKRLMIRKLGFLKKSYFFLFWLGFLFFEDWGKKGGCIIPCYYTLIMLASASLTNILYNRKQNKNEDMVNEQTSTAGEIKD